jgi:hypothetical protein
VTALRAHRLELALLAASTIGALAVLRLVETQIYTEPWTIDPWLYTALMTNFDFSYHWFGGTYYAARLPQIIPGLSLNYFLTPTQAYVVLHLVFFLAGGAFLYLLVRNLFGLRIALFLYPALLTNAVYVNAHTWDYFDGFVITYLSAGLYFLVSAIGGTSRVRPALAGFFLAAAATTNLFSTLLVGGAIVVYAYGRTTVDGRLAVRRITRDAVWFWVGGVVLLAACGWFASAHGGRFLYFRTSIEALNDFSTAQWKLPSYAWMLAEPRLLVPLFVAAATVIAWRGWRSSDRTAVGLALTAVAVGIFAVLVLWEFGFSGTFLQLDYYFSTVYPFFFVALATAVYGLLAWVSSTRQLPLAALSALGLFAGAAPLVAIYGFNGDDLWGRKGAAITLVLMGAALVAAIVLRFVSSRRISFVVAPLAAALAIASVNYGSAANATTYRNLETRNSALADADETFAIGQQLVQFMRRGGLQDSLPGFWYDASADPALTGLQSLYYWQYTYLNLQMPVIDESFRQRMEQLRPKHVILLCTEPTCRSGAAAMRRVGYRIRREAAARLHSGSKSVWVRAYALKSANAWSSKTTSLP